MIRYLLILFVITRIAVNQPLYETVYHFGYDRLPFKLRVDYSGNYGFDGFSIINGKLFILEHDNKSVYQYSENKFRIVENPEVLFNAPKSFIEYRSYSEFRNHPLISIKNNAPDNIKVKYLSDGQYLFSDNTLLDIKRVSSSELKIKLNSKENTYLFSNDLAYADLIGLDINRNLFILNERVISHTPLEIKRSILIIDSTGIICSELEIPLKKYITSFKEFEVDRSGNLFQLLAEENGIRIIKWKIEKIIQKRSHGCPEELKINIHYNNYLPEKELSDNYDPDEPLAVVDRTAALKTGENYVILRYTCSSSNLSPNTIALPDGDSLKTPSRLIVGLNSGVAYKWGGFNSISSYNSGLAAGKYAGDIHTDNSTSYAVGVDCSGFVSRCWQLSSHVATANMPSICTLYPSWDSLKPADAILKSGHVRMFIERTSTGSFRVVESSGRDWGVSYWTYALGDLSLYQPYRYNNISNSFNTKIPVLQQVVLQKDNKIKIKWTCDSVGIKGYRLYKSTDGASWTRIMDENTLSSLTVEIQQTDSTASFRVSSVKNEGPDYAESYWSNVLSYSNYFSPKKYLIVDGFTRIIGNWRSTTNDFILHYAKGFSNLKKRFESVRNSELFSGIDLKLYDAVFWVLGDESTANATISTTEQPLIKSYLEGGGSLFISGSEIGYDLYQKGDNNDKSFYNNYLKAQYVNDNASSLIATGIAGKALSGCSINFGQTYIIDYPDEISANGGSEVCMKYGNSKVAGIQYTGNFGTSSKIGRLIHIAFPVETSASDAELQSVIEKSLIYLSNGGNFYIKFIPQGYYNGTTGKLVIQDTFKIYLANTTAPFAFVDSAVVVLDSVSFTVNALFRNANGGSYYIVIKNRNTLETWSRLNGEPYTKNEVVYYDFTDTDGKSFGNNLMLSGSKWCLYSGDVNQDGQISLDDLLAIDADNQNFSTGYLSTDVNGDGQITLDDLLIADMNNQNFISVQKP